MTSFICLFIYLSIIYKLHIINYFYVDTLYWVQRKSSAQGRTRLAEDDMIYNRDLLKCWSSPPHNMPNFSN